MSNLKVMSAIQNIHGHLHTIDNHFVIYEHKIYSSAKSKKLAHYEPYKQIKSIFDIDLWLHFQTFVNIYILLKSVYKHPSCHLHTIGNYCDK